MRPRDAPIGSARCRRSIRRPGRHRPTGPGSPPGMWRARLRAPVPPDRQMGGHDAIRPVHDALAPAGAPPLRRPPMGPRHPALGRRARLFRGVDRRASHRALGAAPRPRPADRPGADADQADPPRPRRVPVALSPPGRTRQPGGDARSFGAGPAQFRRRRQRPAERLGDVQRRRQRRPAPRDDPRGARHHPQAVDRGGAVRLSGQILAGQQDRSDAAHACGRTSSHCKSPIRRSGSPASARAPTP